MTTPMRFADIRERFASGAVDVFDAFKAVLDALAAQEAIREAVPVRDRGGWQRIIPDEEPAGPTLAKAPVRVEGQYVCPHCGGDLDDR